MTPQTAFENYRRASESLTVDRLDSLDDVLAPNDRFVDPFHETVGIEPMKKAFRRLFDSAENIKFEIIDNACSEGGVYFHWRLTALLSGKPWEVTGVTQAKFNADGLVTEHVEYWDAASQFYERFPIIGPLLRFLRHRVARS